MASIITRAAAGTGATVKGAPLTLAELDANLIALNTDIFVDALPTVEPSLMLDFVNTNELDSRITFTRASTGTYVGPDGLIKTAAANVPRFDYDPVTMACRGLLAEEGRTNLLARSQEFDSASWPATSASVTANNAVAPDGTTTADFLVGAAGTGYFLGVRQAFSYTANTWYTASVYAKAGAATRLVLATDNGAGYLTHALFDLAAGTSASVTHPDVASNLSTSITPVGNGWFRCVFSFWYLGGMGGLRIMPAVSTTAGSFWWSLTNDGVSGLHIWGAQLESAAFVTSYIPTGAAQATRAADYGVINNVHQSTWYSMDRGSMVIEFRNDYMAQSHAGAAFAFAGGWRNNTIFLNPRRDGTFGPNGALIYVYESLGISPSVSVSGGTNLNNSASAVYKYAGAWDAESLAIAATNYQVASTSKTARAPTPTFLAFPTDTYSYNPFSGHIRRFAYYPRRVTNAQLQALID